MLLFGTLGAGCARSAPSSESPPASSPPAPAADTRARTGHAHWSYDGPDGPTHWGELSADFDLCRTGAQQSPIDLPASAEASHAPRLEFLYRPFPLSIVNTGHSLQVAAAPGSILVAGPTPADRYELVQFHFHSPSEHSLAGVAFDLELHLVHKNASGNLLVVGLLFRKGKENPALKPIFALAPTAAGQDARGESLATVDPGALVPANAGYFHYTGSLTAPPCSEGVAWYVLSTIGEVSEDQIARYQGLFHGATNRPAQPLHGRSVVEYRP